MGNYTIGIKDNTIFPETADQDIKDAFGLAITIVLSSKQKEETLAFLELIGLPFKSSRIMCWKGRNFIDISFAC